MPINLREQPQWEERSAQLFFTSLVSSLCISRFLDTTLSLLNNGKRQRTGLHSPCTLADAIHLSQGAKAKLKPNFLDLKKLKKKEFFFVHKIRQNLMKTLSIEKKSKTFYFNNSKNLNLILKNKSAFLSIKTLSVKIFFS